MADREAAAAAVEASARLAAGKHFDDAPQRAIVDMMGGALEGKDELTAMQVGGRVDDGGGDRRRELTGQRVVDGGVGGLRGLRGLISPLAMLCRTASATRSGWTRRRQTR